MKLGLSARLEGDKALRKRIDQLARDYPLALGAALYQEGFGLWADAVKRTPVEFGVLRNSAYVSPPMQRKGEVTIEVGYGTKYAVRQHEETGYQHTRGGEAKYLANAIAARTSGFLERLAQRTEANVKANVRAPTVQAPTTPPPSSGGRVLRRVRRARAARRTR